MTKTAPIPSLVLDEQWHAFRLKVFRKLEEVVAKEKAKDVDQKEIARRLGMDEAQLSRALSGRYNVTLRTMHNIARALGFRPEIEFKRLSPLRIPNMPQEDRVWLSAESTISEARSIHSASSVTTDDRFSLVI